MDNNGDQITVKSNMKINTIAHIRKSLCNKDFIIIDVNEVRDFLLNPLF